MTAVSASAITSPAMRVPLIVSSGFIVFLPFAWNGAEYNARPFHDASLRRNRMDALERIKKQVTENPIILYMKGSPDFPQCGFSARAVQALKSCNVPFAYVNIY